MNDDNSAGMVCGPDGCEVPATEARLPDVAAVGTRIDIVSDAICPWCYVGKRQLERALAMLAEEGLHFQVHWNPFQLNPDMPKEGRDRAAYRAWKFGSAEKSAAIDQRINEAAASVGLGFRTDLMTRTPNTIDAHRVIWFAGQNGVQDAAMEAVFKAYFIEGRDIGEHAVLADCGAEAGLPRQAVLDFLATDIADNEMRAADQAAREAGVSGVPSFFLDGHSLFSGAMPAETIANALRRGQEILRKQQEAA
ncbi:MAG TPA: disulfide bond formation protein DsbA [Acetobacteraceae bacterium]|jgi:predicted DsbA family dithiol-disulfide isomerase|nr:disulfide bond formation protein DsbA [Acetobacteraceae bacterium]